MAVVREKTTAHILSGVPGWIGKKERDSDYSFWYYMPPALGDGKSVADPAPIRLRLHSYGTYIERKTTMGILRRKVRSLILLGILMGCVSFCYDSAYAIPAEEIDANVNAAIEDFYAQVPNGRELAGKASGMLVFPWVLKAGFIGGGEYGEGALRVGGQTVEYYATASVSFGLQIGVQSKAIILLFMTENSVANFQNSDGWEAGVDGSVALIEVGAAGSIDTTKIQGPIIGFVIGNKGLMLNLSIEGSKFTKLKR
jgi:lipid-binding SYLF domain-containing protein